MKVMYISGRLNRDTQSMFHSYDIHNDLWDRARGLFDSCSCCTGLVPIVLLYCIQIFSGLTDCFVETYI